MASGKTEAAKSIVKDFQEEFPDLAFGFQMAGDLSMQSGDYANAVSAYQTALQKQPSTLLLLKQFRAQRAAGNPETAMALLTDWLIQHPDDVQVHRMLAILHREAGRQESAKQHYEATVRLQPDNALALNNLAGFYSAIGDARALGVARRAHELAPKHPAVNDTLGWILVQMGEHEEGLIYLREAHARAFQQPEVRYHLAVALHRLGRNSEARQELEAALAAENPFAQEPEARALLQRIEGGL
jgi:Flp pilus assembly protein TadD